MIICRKCEDLLTLSASESGISKPNSSSIAITTSTASNESRSRSSLNLALAVTFAFCIYNVCIVMNDIINMIKYCNIPFQNS
jgi:hypothetical protein